MNSTQKQRLVRCIGYLMPIARAAEEGACEVHWIAARNADPDQGPSYCYECGSTEVEALNAAHPEHEYMLDGGWGSHDSDRQETCDKCGKLLATNLTDYGVQQELDHWGSTRITLRGRHGPESAYILMRVLECAPLDDYSTLHLKEYETDMIKKIQRDTHRLTRRIDAIRRSAFRAKQGGQPYLES